jgi:hypothetical protein
MDDAAVVVTQTIASGALMWSRMKSLRHTPEGLSWLNR